MTIPFYHLKILEGGLAVLLNYNILLAPYPGMKSQAYNTSIYKSLPYTIIYVLKVIERLRKIEITVSVSYNISETDF